jgi:glycosyltransferase involved in cell wall biosynthesis
VDVACFAPRTDVQEVEGLIFFAGTLTEKKGIRQLLLAMQLILEEVRHARLWVAGRDSRDLQTGQSYLSRLEKVLPAACKPHVTFLGPVEHEQMPHLIGQAEVCVYPSHMEVLPLAWLEAMAMGKAVVASQTGPGPEVIEPEVSGLLCDPHDPQSIARCVLRLLKDRPLRQRLAAAARDRAVKTFATSKLVAVNEEFYARCIAQRG